MRFTLRRIFTLFMKNFPPEITDLTIDLLNGDWQSLYNCALVCRAWFPRSRYNLLRNIRLTKHSEALMLMHRFREACIPEDQSPRELSIVEDHAPDSRPFVHTVPSIFLRTTSSMMLESLSIDGIRWREGVVPPGHPFWSSLSQLTSLTSLTLDNCRFVNFRQFQRLVYVLPQLSHLKISRGTTWSRRKTPILHTHLPRLRQLEIDGCNRRVTSALLRWVCDTPTCQSLRQLVYEPPPRSRDALGDMAVALALAARIFSPQWDCERTSTALSHLDIPDSHLQMTE
ncbi:uncharacterized protein FIBRA_03381 [Fibroporia radiculosa]|uniref:F-box domain-containing protein n=1 Tax=Fibroporia radiculosa TaxID=599839 RepID=J4HVY7_9APHY|nr:uncharacterized protein FIBRA_03381 [Fibroporia radiculosa]CCM01332.1 predicted protein [Fibroporia radiculosa]